MAWNGRQWSGAAPARLCNRSIFNRTNTQHRVGESRPQTRAAIACPAAPSLRLLSSPACFRYALLVFAAAVHENVELTPRNTHRADLPGLLHIRVCVSVSECRWLCHVEPVLVLLHASVKVYVGLYLDHEEAKNQSCVVVFVFFFLLCDSQLLFGCYPLSHVCVLSYSSSQCRPSVVRFELGFAATP